MQGSFSSLLLKKGKDDYSVYENEQSQAITKMLAVPTSEIIQCLFRSLSASVQAFSH